MESEKPKRNLYRGLLRHIRENYDWKNATPAAITAALQKEERWRGVSIGSVAPTVSALRAEAQNGAKKQKRLDVLITLPLPRKQTATLTYDEARAVYSMLARMFNGV